LFQDANIETGGGGRKVLQMYQEMVWFFECSCPMYILPKVAV
jgi:hypothetical protein